MTCTKDGETKQYIKFAFLSIFQSVASLAKSNQNSEDASILLSNATDLEAQITKMQTDVESK